MTRSNAHAADVRGIMGATGMGKSTYVRATLRRLKPSRLLVWDFKREYQMDHFESMGDLVAAVAAAGRRGFRLAFWPAGDDKARAAQFDMFCRLAQRAGNLTMLVEELAFVTEPGRAPGAWKLITCTGRADGLRVIGTSQRPAHIDKHFLGACTEIVSFRLPHPADAKAVGEAMICDWQTLLTLQEHHYMRRVNGQVESGKNPPIRNG